MKIFFLICILLIIFGIIWIILSVEYGSSIGNLIYKYIKRLLGVEDNQIIQVQQTGENSSAIQIVNNSQELISNPEFSDLEIREMEKDIFNPCFGCDSMFDCSKVDCKKRMRYLNQKRKEFDSRSF